MTRPIHANGTAATPPARIPHIDYNPLGAGRFIRSKTT